MRYFKNEVLNGLALELRDFAEKQAVAENTTFWKILRNKTNEGKSVKEMSALH